MCKSIGSLFFARAERKVPCLHEHLTSAATVSELVSETSPKGGGAYDLDLMILELKLAINDNLRNGGNHNGKEEKC